MARLGGLLESERRGGNLLVPLCGEYRDEDAVAMTREFFRELLRCDRVQNMVLDLSVLTGYQNDYFFSLLAWVSNELRLRGGRLAVCSIPDLIHDVLTMLGFERIMLLAADREQAIAALC